MDDFNPRERLIGKGLRAEETKIFYTHSFGKAVYNCCKISPPNEKYFQDVSHGAIPRCVATSHKDKGKRGYLKAMLNVWYTVVMNEKLVSWKYIKLVYIYILLYK